MSAAENTSGASAGRAVGPGTHLFVWCGGLLIVGLIVWSALGRLDIVSEAAGEVVPSTQVKQVQHLEGGIIREFHVREGDPVTQGQPIVSLEPTRSGADVRELETRIAALSADVARLIAERDNLEQPIFPAGLESAHPDLVAQSRGLFDKRRERLANELALQREVVDQRSAELRETEVRIGNLKTRVALIKEQVDISTRLLEDEMTHRMKHLELVSQYETLAGQLAESKASIGRLAAQRNQAQLRLDSIRNDFQNEVREDLEKASRALEEHTERLAKFEDSLERTVLRSPESGIIKTLHVATVGGVVRPGATVADVVPEGDRLVIEARLPVSEIGHVAAGQRVAVRLETFDSIRFGAIDGVVARISPDAIKQADEPPYYAVSIETEETAFRSNAGVYRLVPGVRVICSVITGERSVLEYVLDPILGSAMTAMRER